jgi:EmrB/QacA subfamily drug resistance transporter
MPSTLSILTNSFTDPHERSKAIGIWAGVSATGIGLGPVMGGVLLSHFAWGAVFLVNVPVIIFALVAGYLFVPESRDPSAPKLDPVGSGLSIVGLSVLLWAIIEAPTDGWLSSSTVVVFAIAFIILTAFLFWELHSSHPMLELRFFRNRRFSAANATVTLTCLVLYGLLFLLTLYLQSVLGFTAVQAGACLIPQAISMMIFAPLSAHWVHRYGSKAVVSVGLLIMMVMMLLMATLTQYSALWQVIVITTLLGVGIGNVMPPSTESIMGSLPREKAGVGSAMNDTTRQVGGALGVALFGSIVASRYASQIVGGLAGVPPSLTVEAKSSLGSALGLVTDNPAAQPYASQISNAAKDAFASGLHVTMLVGVVVLVGALVCVVKWLPSRAEDSGTVPAAVADVVPTGLGPVDVVPASMAADLAEELEFRRGTAAGG